jgi:hypothetical protein
MHRLAALLVLAVALAAAGCGSDTPATPNDDPGAFVSTLVRMLFRQESGGAWETLHPLHRSTVSRERYVECERRAPLQGEVRQIEVLSVRDEPATVPGQEEPQPSKAVTVRLTLKLPGLATPGPVTHTAHLFAVDGRWAWVIGPTDFASYAIGECPAPAGTNAE